LNALQANPRSASLHNTLGQLLLQKGFPKDAETEFERSVNADPHFYPAWYNLGLVRMSRGDLIGSHFAFSRTVHYKPGHSAALFQLGLMEEKRNHQRAAIDYYAKAFLINHSLLDVRVNPRILDSKLVDLALLKAYPNEHSRESMAFQPAPPGYIQQGLEAPSTQPSAQQIVTPSLPLTDPSQQGTAPSQPAPQPAKPPR
jgi:tetratricopeptide (TPR) repeat protein